MPGATVAELSNVSVSFGSVTALVDVNLSIGVDERVILVGQSGSGKTTLLNLLSGLVTPSTGSVSVFGQRLDTLTGRALRRHRSLVGVVGQQLDLALPLRVVHNVNAGLLGRWSTAAAVASLIRPAGSDSVLEVLDKVGLADRYDARTADLSGGERQRVAVARILRQGPKLVLADEPTSSVDPRLADDVMSLLSPPSSGGWTSIVSVHDPQLGQRHGDRVVGLRAGRVMFDLPADQVDEGALAELYHRQ